MGIVKNVLAYERCIALKPTIKGLACKQIFSHEYLKQYFECPNSIFVLHLLVGFILLFYWKVIFPFIYTFYENILEYNLSLQL